MGRRTEQAYRDLEKSSFRFINDATLEITNAVMLWPNFSGKPNKYGNSARTFNVCLSPEFAEELNKRGFRIRDVDVKEITDADGNPAKLYFVNIKVNMDVAYPPSVTLLSTFRGKKSRRTLNIESIGQLDSIDLKNDETTTGLDIVVNCYRSRQQPDKLTGYLKKAYVTQDDNVEFGGKYDDWEEEVEGDALGLNGLDEENPLK